MKNRVPLALSLLALACSTPGPEPEEIRLLPPGAQAYSLFGQPLFAPPLTDEEYVRREEQLFDALHAPCESVADGLVWIGRRVAYLNNFEDAVLIFVAGIALYPDDARFPRHLGHRWITLRRFDDAERELAHAAALERGREDTVEPDGQPNAAGIPLTTLQSNIYYHLGLARYLRGDFEGALEAYAAYRLVNDDDDGEVAIDHWQLMALRRLGRFEQAAALVQDVGADMTILENTSYYRLCLMYKGELDPDALWAEVLDGDSVDKASVGYCIGNWYYTGGRKDEALEVWLAVLQGESWHAFGFISAEAELARLGLEP
jgi:tetratricopeptide (TPR) repeat protein